MAQPRILEYGPRLHNWAIGGRGRESAPQIPVTCVWEPGITSYYHTVRFLFFFGCLFLTLKSAKDQQNQPSSAICASQIKFSSIFAQMSQIIFSIAGPLINSPSFVFFRITFNKYIYNNSFRTSPFLLRPLKRGGERASTSFKWGKAMKPAVER